MHMPCRQLLTTTPLPLRSLPIERAMQSVKHDLDLFVKINGLTLTFNPEEGEETWYLLKPA